MSQLEAVCVSIVFELIAVMGIASLLRWFRYVHPIRLALTCIAATLVTHPIGWWAIDHWLVDAMSYGARVAIIECVVVIVEAVFYTWFAQLASRRAILASVVANAASLGGGLLLFSS